MSFPAPLLLYFNEEEATRGVTDERTPTRVFGRCVHRAAGLGGREDRQDIGTWQTAALTQLTGFVAALLILSLLRDGQWRKLPQAKPLYLTGGAFGAVIIFANVTAIGEIGATLTISALLIAQLL